MVECSTFFRLIIQVLLFARAMIPSSIRFESFQFSSYARAAALKGSVDSINDGDSMILLLDSVLVLLSASQTGLKKALAEDRDGSDDDDDDVASSAFSIEERSTKYFSLIKFNTQ